MRAQAFFYLLPAMYAVFALIFFGAWRAERVAVARIGAIGFALIVVAIPVDMLRPGVMPPPWDHAFLFAIALHWASILVVSQAFLSRHHAHFDRRLALLTVLAGTVAVVATTLLDAKEHRIITVALTAAALLAPIAGQLWRHRRTTLDHIIFGAFLLSISSYLGRALTLRLSTMGNEVARAPVFSSYWNLFYVLVAVMGLIQGLLLTVAITFDLAQRSRDRSHRDALTGLANRRALEDIADQQGRIGTVVMIDLDHFKAINDRYGHAAGDEVLRCVARAIALHTNDGTVVRMGGEEFAVLVPRGCDGLGLARQLREEIAALEIVHDGRAIPVTASIGVARHDAESPLTALDELLRNSDAALYRAKDAGRNRVELFQRAVA